MSDQEAAGGTKTASKERIKVQRPKMYKVLLLNDDYTSMDFVVSILETIFKKSPAEAVQIMLKVHKAGQGLCGIFAKQIAEAKVHMVHERARDAGFPLRALMEEE